MSNKEKFDIEGFLKEHKAIFNYIYDDRGLKRGIVLAMKTPLKGKCKIGWALFDENSNIDCKVLSKLRDIPEIMRKLNSIKDSVYKLTEREEAKGNKEDRKDLISILQEVRSLEDTKLGEIDTYTFPTDPKDVENLFLSAVSRANHDSWNYYCAKGTDLSKTDLREGVISIQKLKDEKLDGVYCLYHYCNSDSKELCKNIRKAIRKMEHRAWKYFKC